jgi:alpha-ketoglutarate-dependent taurine dioxygenase
VDAWFGKESGISCLHHSSPTVLTVANIGPAHAEHQGARGRTVDGTPWHTDIEYEPVPMHVSMLLTQHTPTKRDPGTGTWVVEDSTWGQSVLPYDEGE